MLKMRRDWIAAGVEGSVEVGGGCPKLALVLRLLSAHFHLHQQIFKPKSSRSGHGGCDGDVGRERADG